jgi:hypothetical protein
VTAVVLLVILLSGHHNVTWLPKSLTCGRFPWKAPTGVSENVQVSSLPLWRELLVSSRA